MGIPLENVTIILDMPVWKSQELMTLRYNGDEEKKDIHESNVPYMNTCHESMLSAVDILNTAGYNWVLMNCLDEGNNVKSVETMFESILEKVLAIISWC